MPLMDGGIKLVHQVSMHNQDAVVVLTAVPTSATMATGTLCTVIPWEF